MLPPIPFSLSLRIYFVLIVLAAILARVLFRAVLQSRTAHISAAVFLLMVAAAHAAWWVGMLYYPISYWGAAVASTLLMLFIFFVVSLPIAALVGAVLKRAVLRAPAAAPQASPDPESSRKIGRRAFVGAATAAVPLLAVGTGASGFLRASNLVVPHVPFTFANLPTALEGFTILQLSDLHLGMSK
ncbi:MAG: hypothetical protein ABI461_06130, partial [Polyangiaceae bacterium]